MSLLQKVSAFFNVICIVSILVLISAFALVNFPEMQSLFLTIGLLGLFGGAMLSALFSENQNPDAFMISGSNIA